MQYFKDNVGELAALMGFGEGIKGAFADWQERNRQTYGLLISGGVAGSVAKTATAPLSRCAQIVRDPYIALVGLSSALALLKI